MATDRAELGRKLREVRVAAGLSRPELGLQVAIDSSRLERIESGRARIRPDELHFLLDACDRLDLYSELSASNEVLVLG